MKRLCMSMLSAWFLFAGIVRAAETNGPAETAPNPAEADSGGLVYIIPIRGEIEPALVYVIRRGVNEATADGAKAVIFVMDTPGGRIDAATDIIRAIGELKIPTYTFVEHHAFSAGALISFATKHIYMSPGSVIGDAMPIMISPTGDVQPMPEALQEKSVSAVAAMARSAAQQNGHDPQLAEKMVRREIEYKIGDELISPTNQLLTLTNVEAERMVGSGEAKRHLLSEGTVGSVDELLKTIGLAHADTKELVISLAEKVARYISEFAPIFLMAGLLGIYIEIKTPGVVLPGVIGALSLAAFFWGHHIAGLAGLEEVLIFIVGVVLLLVELVVFPGTAILGITGGILILWALLTAMIVHYPDDPWYPSFPQVKVVLPTLALGIVGAGIGAALLIRVLPRISLFNRLALAQTSNRNEGYTASAITTDLLGREGLAVTPLHPGGSAMFGERRHDVVTRGDFVENGARIVVVEAHGSRIVVEPAKDKPV